MQEFTDCEFINVEEGAMAYFEAPDDSWANLSDCGDFPCSGPLNTFLYLNDATFSGDTTPTVTFSDQYLLPNNPGFSPYVDGGCIYTELMNGYVCSAVATDLGMLIFESLDDDSWDRSLQPIYMEMDGTDQNNVVNAFMDKVWDTFYTGQVRMSRFPVVVDPGMTDYQMTLSGSPPKNQRYMLRSPIDEAGMIIRITYSNAMAYGMYDTGGDIIAPNEYDDTTEEAGEITKAFCGENRYMSEINQLEFYIEKDCILEIKERNVIQAMVRMSFSLDSFFSDGGTTTFMDKLAGSLGIHASTIKVVSVYEGSVVLDYEIGVSDDVEEGSDEALAALSAIQSDQTEMFVDGSFAEDMGTELLDVAVGAKDSATTLIADGITTIVYQEFSNTLPCAKCIKSGYGYVYNYNVWERPEVDPVYDEEGNEIIEEEVIDPDTLPSYYQDLGDDDESKGWCCE